MTDEPKKTIEQLTEAPRSWWAGASEERFDILGCDTRERALVEAIGQCCWDEIGPSNDTRRVVYVIEAEPSVVRVSEYFDVNSFLEMAEEALDEFQNPDGPDAIIDCSQDQQQDLQRRVRAAIDEWQVEHQLTFQGWAAGWSSAVEAVDVTDETADDAS